MNAKVMPAFRVAVALVVATGLIGGCQKGPQTAPIAGAVNLDGVALDDAVIEFDSGDGSVPASLNIVRGAFSGGVTLGTKTVRIFAMRPARKSRSGLGATDVQNPLENIIPHRYGYDSTVTVAIGAEGNTNLNYQLESKSESRGSK